MKTNLTIRISPELRKQLEDIAASENRTVSNLIHLLLTEAVKHHAQS